VPESRSGNGEEERSISSFSESSPVLPIGGHLLYLLTCLHTHCAVETASSNYVMCKL
jgi:hypothetical protein